MILINGDEINWEAYELGFKSCEENKPGNPFERHTTDWYSWNKGWSACDQFIND